MDPKYIPHLHVGRAWFSRPDIVAISVAKCSMDRDFCMLLLTSPPGTKLHISACPVLWLQNPEANIRQRISLQWPTVCEVRTGRILLTAGSTPAKDTEANESAISSAADRNVWASSINKSGSIKADLVAGELEASNANSMQQPGHGLKPNCRRAVCTQLDKVIATHPVMST